MARQKSFRNQSRFGIGEWYGHLFHKLTPEERLYFANLQKIPRGEREKLPCPFQGDGIEIKCTKQGGVCSVRRYYKYTETGSVEIPSDTTGRLRTVCPNRFREDGLIYRKVGEKILGISDPLVVNEVGFLSGISPAGEEGVEGDDVGRIDQVLLQPNYQEDVQHLQWCALEVQAVYLSGSSMTNDFKAIRTHIGDGIPFPPVLHRPDYRSSGPKRLMPQLQIKVPTLRRWGKKMAVVVDRDFFEALAPMDEVPHISNCDIVWFVLDYQEEEGLEHAHLVVGDIHLTTLEDAVEGLTAGKPVPKEEFERRILEQFTKQAKKRQGKIS